MYAFLLFGNHRRNPGFHMEMPPVRVAGKLLQLLVPSIWTLNTDGSNPQLSVLQTMINVITWARNLLYSVQKVDTPTLKSNEYAGLLENWIM